METLDIKGFPVETHIAGSGPPLLYLHAEQYFEQVRPYLDALAKKWSVIAPRHPGYGAASGATDLRSVDDLAYLYLDLLDELKLDNVVLVGASFGGWIALEMCVRNHARLSKLVLVSSVGVKAGVKMALGSDIRPLKDAALLELGLWVRDGATPWQALVAATRHGAAVCGVSNELGTIEVGKLADLIVVGGNPLEDIQNVRQLKLVLKEGVIVSDKRE
jgi:pimeloyl-ACP methyl ester carboxylesterase